MNNIPVFLENKKNKAPFAGSPVLRSQKIRPSWAFRSESSSGKKTVLLPLLHGADGVSWSYRLTCPYRVQPNTLFAAVREYFKIMNNQEELNPDEEGYFKLPADGDTHVFDADIGR